MCIGRNAIDDGWIMMNCACGLLRLDVFYVYWMLDVIVDFLFALCFSVLPYLLYRTHAVHCECLPCWCAH